MAENEVNIRVGRVQLTSVKTGLLWRTIAPGCLALRIINPEYFEKYYRSQKSDKNVHPCESCRAAKGLSSMHTANITGKDVTMVCGNLKGQKIKLETRVIFAVTGGSEASGGSEIGPKQVAAYLKKSGLVSCS